jgi:hypothetical protein
MQTVESVDSTLATLLLKARQNDPFNRRLQGQTYEKLSYQDKATECYRKSAATHNPPARSPARE